MNGFFFKFIFMKIFAVFINTIIGLFFVLSAYYKMYPIEYFEAKIATYGFSGVLVSVISRLVIGFELLIGIFLFYQLTFNKRIQKITMLLVGFFLLINVYDLIVNGNDSNCGCMGMAISFTPLASVFKNIILLILLFISIKYSTIELKVKNEWLVYLCVFVPFTLVLLLKPIYIYNDFKMPLKGKRVDFSIMLNHKGFKGKTYNEDLSKGKKVVAFLSLTCVHCKVAGFKLTGYKASNPELPIYFILNGDSTKMPEFFKAAGGANIGKAHFNGKDDYAAMSGYNLPAVFLLNNSVVEAQFNAESLNKQEILDWFSKK